MQVKLKPKTYGPLRVNLPADGAPRFTSEAGFQGAGALSPQADGLSPSDLLLASLGTCITISMRMAAQQMGLTLGELHAVASADKATDLPHRFARLTVEVHAPDALDDAVAQELVQRTKALCTVSNTLGAEVVLNLRTGASAPAAPVA